MFWMGPMRAWRLYGRREPDPLAPPDSFRFGGAQEFAVGRHGWKNRRATKRWRMESLQLLGEVVEGERSILTGSFRGWLERTASAHRPRSPSR